MERKAIELIQKMAWIAWTMMIDGRSCPAPGSSPPAHGPTTMMMSIQTTPVTFTSPTFYKSPSQTAQAHHHCKEKKSCIRLNISESIILCLSSNSPTVSSASFEHAVSYKTQSKTCL
jgi:hypothetical protein